MKYFIPLTLLSENGNPIRSDMVELRDSNNTVVYTLSYWKAGQYYNDAPIAFGNYDVYVDGYFYANIDFADSIVLDNETIGVVDGEIATLFGGYRRDDTIDTPHGVLQSSRPGEMFYTDKKGKLFIARMGDDNDDWTVVVGNIRSIDTSTEPPVGNGEIVRDSTTGKPRIAFGMTVDSWQDFGWTPDNSSLEVVNGIISVKYGGITEEERAPIRQFSDDPTTVQPLRRGETIYTSFAGKEGLWMSEGITNVDWKKIDNDDSMQVDEITLTIDVSGIISVKDGGIGAIQLANSVPKAVDDSTIELNASGVISVKYDGITEEERAPIRLLSDDPTTVQPLRRGETIYTSFAGKEGLWMSEGITNVDWKKIDNDGGMQVDDVEDLIYKEGSGNPNANSVTIDRLGQVYCNTNNNATFIAVNSNNPTWKKIT